MAKTQGFFHLMRPDSRKRNIAVKLAEHSQTNVLCVTPGPMDNIPNDVIIIIVNRVREGQLFERHNGHQAGVGDFHHHHHHDEHLLRGVADTELV